MLNLSVAYIIFYNFQSTINIYQILYLFERNPLILKDFRIMYNYLYEYIISLKSKLSEQLDKFKIKHLVLNLVLKVFKSLVCILHV